MTAPDELVERYLRHIDGAHVSSGRRQVWHIAAARGLYRLLADRELAGGEPAPMGMPHVLCVTDAEVRGME